MGVPVFYQGSKYKPGKLVAIPIPPVPDLIGDALRADAVAYWTMNEASGTRLDSTSHNHSLAEGDTTINDVAGIIANAAQFLCNESGNPWLQNLDTYNLLNFYLAFWFRVPIAQTETGAHYANVFSIGTNSGDMVTIEVRGDKADLANPTLSIVAYVQSVPFPDEAAAEIGGDLTAWHFAEIWRSSGTLYVAADNATPASVNGGTNLFDSEIYVGLGSLGAFTLYVDESLLLGRAPTSDERDYLYNSGAGRALFPAP